MYATVACPLSYIYKNRKCFLILNSLVVFCPSIRLLTQKKTEWKKKLSRSCQQYGNIPGIVNRIFFFSREDLHISFSFCLIWLECQFGRFHAFSRRYLLLKEKKKSEKPPFVFAWILTLPRKGIWRLFFCAMLNTNSIFLLLFLLFLVLSLSFSGNNLHKSLDIPTAFNLLCTCFSTLLRIKPWSQFLVTHTKILQLLL